MVGWQKILKGNLIVKAIALVAFSLMARYFNASEIAYYALIPAITLLIYAVSGLGLPALLEKYAPAMEAEERSTLILSAGGVQLAIGGLLCIAVFLIFEPVASFMSMPAGWGDLKALICLAFFVSLSCKILLNALICTGDFTSYTRVFVVLESLTKILPLLAFGLLDGAILIAYLVALVISAGYGFYVYFRTLPHFNVDFYKLFALLRQYPWLYVESIFNSLRMAGDTLLVSIFLGEENLSIYYIIKRVAEQIAPLASAIVRSSTHYLSVLRNAPVSVRNKELQIKLDGVLTLFMLVVALYSIVSLPLTLVMAGSAYESYMVLSGLLVFHYGLFTTLSLLLKVLLNFGSHVHRFLFSLSQFCIFILLFVFVFKAFGVWGLAFSLLISDLVILLGVVWVLRSLGIILHKGIFRAYGLIALAVGGLILLSRLPKFFPVVSWESIGSYSVVWFVFLAIAWFIVGRNARDECKGFVLKKLNRV